jgi:Ni,Fe-hydrogenase III large subunit/Ni,Fe-hydrogenase III component G
MNIENIKQYIPENAKSELFKNAAIFEVPASNIKEVVIDLHGNKNLPLKLITAADEREQNEGFKIWYIFGVPKQNLFVIPFIQLKNTEEFPSMTPFIHEAWNYERQIQTFFGLTPVGHPDTRRIILHENWPADVFPLRKDFIWQTRPAVADVTYQFQRVEGEGIYEIPVGPIHAGIIEPGHFRFSVAGEEIVLLEPRLGYTHKGSEKLFEILPLNDKVRLSEKISGDSSFSHSLAFCQALEDLSNCLPPKRALYLRVIYSELERLANHFGDIGAIMLDTGFNFGGAQGARLREMIMQINERITGSRFLRGINMPGGVAKDISESGINILSAELGIITEDFSEIIKIAENNTSLLNRLRGTGVLSYEFAKDHGVVGIAAKAVGIQCDARVDFPYAAYDELHPDEIATEQGGDVYARFGVRVKEAYASINIIQLALRKLPEGIISVPTGNLVFKKNAIAVSIVEGWRGEIVYFITTDSNGNISRVAPRDPSSVNWRVLASAGLGNIIPDFPLINKSFNLSYSGNDL